MRLKTQIMDEAAVTRALKRIAHEIIEKNDGVSGVCLVGIHRRGVPLAETLQKNIEAIEGTAVPVGRVDITLYRDDLTQLSDMPAVSDTSVPFDVNGRRVVLVDDVLYNRPDGARRDRRRFFRWGRPACVQLAVLVDRGHRELPIRPDFVGKNLPTARGELVAVCLPPFDGETAVKLYDLTDAG